VEIALMYRGLRAACASVHTHTHVRNLVMLFRFAILPTSLQDRAFGLL